MDRGQQEEAQVEDSSPQGASCYFWGDGLLIYSRCLSYLQNFVLVFVIMSSCCLPRPLNCRRELPSLTRWATTTIISSRGCSLCQITRGHWDRVLSTNGNIFEACTMPVPLKKTILQSSGMRLLLSWDRLPWGLSWFNCKLKITVHITKGAKI